MMRVCVLGVCVEWGGVMPLYIVGPGPSERANPMMTVYKLACP